MTTPAGPPPEAVTAAHAAADEGWAPHAPGNVHAAVDRALEAATPHIRAAERERCAQLAEKHKAEFLSEGCEGECPHLADGNTRMFGSHWHPFADLLREQP